MTFFDAFRLKEKELVILKGQKHDSFIKIKNKKILD